MAIVALARRARIALRDLVQRLDAVILEEESRGVLLRRSMSSSTTGLGRISTQFFATSCLNSPGKGLRANIKAISTILVVALGRGYVADNFPR